MVESTRELVNDRPQIDLDVDVFITDWSDMPSRDAAGLGLGLGAPQFVRKPTWYLWLVYRAAEEGESTFTFGGVGGRCRRRLM